MALIIEDGTGVAGANSYISLADFRATIPAVIPTPADDATAEAWLITAAKRMGNENEFRWIGERTYTGIAWPRTGAVKRSCEVLSPTFIPSQIVNGQAMLAVSLYQGSLNQLVPGGGAPLTKYAVEVGDKVAELKEFGVVKGGAGHSLGATALGDPSDQFHDFLRYGGLFAIRA